MESMSKAHFISVAELLTQLQTEGFSYGKKQLRIDHLILFNVSLLLRFFHFFLHFLNINEHGRGRMCSGADPNASKLRLFPW